MHRDHAMFSYFSIAAKIWMHRLRGVGGNNVDLMQMAIFLSKIFALWMLRTIERASVFVIFLFSSMSLWLVFDELFGHATSSVWSDFIVDAHISPAGIASLLGFSYTVLALVVIIHSIVGKRLFLANLQSIVHEQAVVAQQILEETHQDYTKEIQSALRRARIYSAPFRIGTLTTAASAHFVLWALFFAVFLIVAALTSTM